MQTAATALRHPWVEADRLRRGVKLVERSREQLFAAVRRAGHLQRAHGSNTFSTSMVGGAMT
jgi:hypothetical protein